MEDVRKYFEQKKYIFLKKIGKGGQGEAILFLNDKQEFVVVKKKRPNALSALTSFKKEAESLIKISKQKNSYVIRFIDYHEEIDAIEMEYAAGGTLREWLFTKKSQATLWEKLKICLDILYGLRDIHSENIIHRDIKPENIAFCAGTAKIMDFGMAKDINVSSLAPVLSVSPSGSIIYDAPEVAMNNYMQFGGTLNELNKNFAIFFKKIDGKEEDKESIVRQEDNKKITLYKLKLQKNCDIFSLGIVFGEIFSDGENFLDQYATSRMQAWLNRAVNGFSEKNFSIKIHCMKDIILKMLEQSPYKRYAAVEEIIDELMKLDDITNNAIRISKKKPEESDVIQVNEKKYLIIKKIPKDTKIKKYLIWVYT